MRIDPFLVEAHAVFLALARIVEAALGTIGCAEDGDDRVARWAFVHISAHTSAHTSKLSGKGHRCSAMWASKSARNCLRNARAAHDAPSASAQMHFPSMKSKVSARVWRSC